MIIMVDSVCYGGDHIRVLIIMPSTATIPQESEAPSASYIETPTSMEFTDQRHRARSTEPYRSDATDPAPPIERSESAEADAHRVRPSPGFARLTVRPTEV